MCSSHSDDDVVACRTNDTSESVNRSHVAGESITMNLEEAAELFLCHCKFARKLSPHTLRAYGGDLGSLASFVGPRSHITACDTGLLRRFARHLLEDRGLAPTSINRKMASIRSMQQWLQNEGILKSGQRPAYPHLKVPMALPRTLPPSDMCRLLSSTDRAFWKAADKQSHQTVLSKADINDTTCHVALEILFSTGIRVGELVAIRIEDMDLNEGTITIHGKGSRQRQVFFTDGAMTSLAEVYVQLHTQRRCSSHLLVCGNGRVPTTQHIRYLIHRARKVAGLERNVTPHVLRHSAATELLEQGVDIRNIQSLLGHRSIVTTQRYTHVTTRALKAAIRSANPRAKIMRKPSATQAHHDGV